MEKGKYYVCNSETSDDDFCAEEANAGIEELSEMSTDDNVEEESEGEGDTSVKTESKDETSTDKSEPVPGSSSEFSKGNNRKSDEAGKCESTAKVQEEKDELESDENDTEIEKEKEHKEALWVGFLTDVKEMPTEIQSTSVSPPKENAGSSRRAACTKPTATSVNCDSKQAKEQDYDCSSDSSDEDFCPDKVNTGNDELSEMSTDDNVEEESEDDNNTSKKTKSKKKKFRKVKANSSVENSDEPCRRVTRQSDDADKCDSSAKVHQEKNALESDDDEKGRSDALWADFLGDVKETRNEIKKTPITPPKENADNAKTVTCTKTEEVTPKSMTITEIMDFAGEEIHVQKTIKTNSIKENKSLPLNNGAGSSIVGVKRSAASSSGGLGSILNNIGKKKKLSVLEKTKMDWNTFKKDEGIAEELQTFNKGKDGFLERQDFLERTDLRQFEIERNLRQTRRNH